MKIGKNIARLRKEKGLTQAELGEKLGVSNQAISKWESEVSSPDISLLPSIADVFECSIDDLFCYIPKQERIHLNMIPGDDLRKDGMGEYVARQIRSQLDDSGSTNKFIEVMLANLEGKFELTDENIERLLDAYREMYRGMRKKKEN
jgi:transcriptional regulator with XRE-family HTH domain